MTYMIDGVAVPKWVYERRQLFGEYAGATFKAVDPAPKKAVRK